MGLSSSMARMAAPKVTNGYVREAMNRAIDGVGPTRSAKESAESRLSEAGGDVEQAVQDLISSHVKMAGAQGFLTNMGGVVTLAVSLPANIAGLGMLQVHLVAAIAHLRGYDLDDPRVRNAVLTCLLGRDTVLSLVKRRRLPAPPMGLATSPVHDAALDDTIAGEVTTELLGRMGGRRAATMVGRRIPLLGGGIGAASDGMSTRAVGRYAAEEFRPRRSGAVRPTE